MSQQSVPSRPVNTQRRNVLICYAAAVVGVCMFLIPLVFEVDMFSGGGALIFVGLLVALSGLAVSRLFVLRSRIMEDMLKGHDLLAHWTYDPAIWRAYAEAEHAEERRDKWNLFWLITAFAVVIGAAFWIADPEVGGVVFLGMLGLVAIIAVTASLSISLPYRHNLAQLGQAMISSRGIYLNGQLHTWVGFLERLEDAGFDPDRHILRVEYSVWNRYSRQYYAVRVPVPEGQEQVAEDIVARLQDRVSGAGRTAFI